MRRAVFPGYLGLVLLALGCGDEDAICRCGPSALELSPPAQPPAQPPETTSSAPLELREGTVSSSEEGIMGRFSVSHSESGSAIALRPGAPGEVCVSGELGVVPDQDWDHYWGAQLSMTLNEPPGGSPSPWAPGDIIGFAFDLSGIVPPALRVAAALHEGDPAADTYCELLTVRPGSTHYALFGQMNTTCWDPSRSEALPQGPLSSIAWRLPADGTIPIEFDFCISQLRPLRSAAE